MVTLNSLQMRFSTLKHYSFVFCFYETSPRFVGRIDGGDLSRASPGRIAQKLPWLGSDMICSSGRAAEGLCKIL